MPKADVSHGRDADYLVKLKVLIVVVSLNLSQPVTKSKTRPAGLMEDAISNVRKSLEYRNIRQKRAA